MILQTENPELPTTEENQYALLRHLESMLEYAYSRKMAFSIYFIRWEMKKQPPLTSIKIPFYFKK